MAREGFFTGLDIGTSSVKVLVAEQRNGELNVIGVSNAKSKGVKDGIKFKTAEDATLYLLSNALISTVPWDDCGSFLRFSVTYNADTIEDEINIMNDLKNRLLSLNLEF